jgi:hypothetical protein
MFRAKQAGMKMRMVSSAMVVIRKEREAMISLSGPAVETAASNTKAGEEAGLSPVFYQASFIKSARRPSNGR